MDKKIEKILITQEEIEAGVQKAADWINTNYKDKKVCFIGVLKGCIPFIGKILPLIKIDCEIEFISASSFKGGLSSVGEIDISDNITNLNITNKEVIILEDIVDTARTLGKIIKFLNDQKPKSLKIVSLLDKQVQRHCPINPDYACFKIPDVFIVGFGLDYKEELRNLPYIGIFNKKYI